MLSKAALATAFMACLAPTEAFVAPGGLAGLSPALRGAKSSPVTLGLRTLPSHGRERASTAVSMNIGERFVRLVKANVSEMLNKAEDPEKMLNQIVEDMQKELVEFRQTYAEVAAGQKRMQKQMMQAQGLSEEWLKRAKLALEKGDEDAARAALERKTQQEDIAKNLKNQMATQETAVENLFQNMKMLEQKISEAKSKKEQLKARAQTAKVATKVNDMLSRTSKSGALQAFERMEEKVEMLEAEAEVAQELSGSDVSLNDRFAKLEQSSKVDDELAALKGMIAGSKSEPKILEANVKVTNSKVDDELQKLRDQLK